MSRKIFTFTQLSNKLDSELAWRRKELTLLFNKVDSKITPINTTLLRAAIPFIYAHWEGYVKIVAESYLEFVANKYEKYSELKIQFVVLAIEKKFSSNNLSDIAKRVKMIELLINEFDKKANVPIKDVIQTKSNLWFDVFEEILFTIGLDTVDFTQFQTVVNDLVDTRNHIAHGHYIKVNYEAYENIHNDIITAMTRLKTEIENAALLFKYRDTTKVAI